MRCITNFNYNFSLLGDGQTLICGGQLLGSAQNTPIVHTWHFATICSVAATMYLMQVNIRIWTPYYIKENYSYLSLNAVTHHLTTRMLLKYIRIAL